MWRYEINSVDPVEQTNRFFFFNELIHIFSSYMENSSLMFPLVLVAGLVQA